MSGKLTEQREQLLLLEGLQTNGSRDSQPSDIFIQCTAAVLKPNTVMIVQAGGMIDAVVDIAGTGKNNVARGYAVNFLIVKKGNVALNIDVDLITAVDMRAVRSQILNIAVFRAVRYVELNGIGKPDHLVENGLQGHVSLPI